MRALLAIMAMIPIMATMALTTIMAIMAARWSTCDRYSRLHNSYMIPIE